jgi:hypothetical protein
MDRIGGCVQSNRLPAIVNERRQGLRANGSNPAPINASNVNGFTVDPGRVGTTAGPARQSEAPDSTDKISADSGVTKTHHRIQPTAIAVGSLTIASSPQR